MLGTFVSLTRGHVVPMRIQIQMFRFFSVRQVRVEEINAG
jgi:hypothetical protein